MQGLYLWQMAKTIKYVTKAHTKEAILLAQMYAMAALIDYEPYNPNLAKMQYVITCSRTFSCLPPIHLRL